MSAQDIISKQTLQKGRLLERNSTGEREETVCGLIIKGVSVCVWPSVERVCVWHSLCEWFERLHEMYVNVQYSEWVCESVSVSVSVCVCVCVCWVFCEKQEEREAPG